MLGYMHAVSIWLPVHLHPIVSERNGVEAPSASSGGNLNMLITDIIVIIALDGNHSNRHDYVFLKNRWLRCVLLHSVCWKRNSRPV